MCFTTTGENTIGHAVCLSVERTAKIGDEQRAQLIQDLKVLLHGSRKVSSFPKWVPEERGSQRDTMEIDEAEVPVS